MVHLINGFLLFGVLFDWLSHCLKKSNGIMVMAETLACG